MQPDIISTDTLWQWLLLPASGALEHHIATPIAWHGRIMVFTWGLLAPLMVLIARYYKITPRQNWPHHLDNPFWFITHRRAGHWIAALATCGLIAVAWKNPSLHPFGSLHGVFGWSLLILGWLQVIGSWARGTHGGPINPFTRQSRPVEEWPGDHFSMTRTRIFFEYTHKTLGWLLLLGSIFTIVSGLHNADAPRWMWIAIGLWWVAIGAACVVFQMQGRCVDTYQAIWGLDPLLPGNRRKPIGWGIRRYTENTLATTPWPRAKK